MIRTHYPQTGMTLVDTEHIRKDTPRCTVCGIPLLLVLAGDCGEPECPGRDQ
jgi:hypothetical protein